MPYTTFSDGSVLTASQVNTNFRDQVISTVTSGTRPAGTEGQIIYETDTDLYYAYNGGWVRFGALTGWTSYTPTLTQSSAVTKTVNYAKYEKVGRMVSVVITLSVTGTGTASNAVTISLPFTATSSTGFGNGYIYDSSAGLVYPGIVEFSTTTTAAFYPASATAGGGSYLGATTFTAALASGDIIKLGCTYETTS